MKIVQYKVVRCVEGADFLKLQKYAKTFMAQKKCHYISFYCKNEI